ncbi:hypothetical protein HanIR_Chr12g0571521 [Helianthus annuus]|nr:hypothetical protein HanIR_Chr12g0571521 [Helianthus annuus]
MPRVAAAMWRLQLRYACYVDDINVREEADKWCLPSENSIIVTPLLGLTPPLDFSSLRSLACVIPHAKVRPTLP